MKKVRGPNSNHDANGPEAQSKIKSNTVTPLYALLRIRNRVKTKDAHFVHNYQNSQMICTCIFGFFLISFWCFFLFFLPSTTRRCLYLHLTRASKSSTSPHKGFFDLHCTRVFFQSSPHKDFKFYHTRVSSNFTLQGLL